MKIPLREGSDTIAEGIRHPASGQRPRAQPAFAADGVAGAPVAAALRERRRQGIERQSARIARKSSLLSLLGILGAVAFVRLDRGGSLPPWLLDNAWVYNRGGTGARTLLGAIASSTTGVAGTAQQIEFAEFARHHY